MEESKKITITIAGRNYPIIVAPNEEQQIKDIEANLKTKYLLSSKDYPHLDTQDHLAMILLSTQIENSESLSDSPNSEETAEKINMIIRKLENHLN